MSAPGCSRVAALVSGRGSNLRALIDARDAGALPVEFVLVASDQLHAPALRRAEEAGIATLALDPKGYANRAAYYADLFSRIAAAKPDLIVLAGFMRILDAAAIAPWRGRMLNIHPSLLPRHPGLRTHEAVLAARDRWHGATVHFVTEQLDGGPAVIQGQFMVAPDDTVETLAERMTVVGIGAELAEEVGALVARFHREGVWHADLNAHNILLAPAGLYLIDFDRGRFRAPADGWRLANLQRLRRSLIKLGGAEGREEAFDRDVWASVLRGYERTFGA